MLSRDFVLIGTGRTAQLDRPSISFRAPLRVITTDDPRSVARCLRDLEHALKDGHYIAGFLSYELGFVLEEKLHKHYQRPRTPLLWFGVYMRPEQLPQEALASGTEHYHISRPNIVEAYERYEKAIERIKKHIRRGNTYQINYTTRLAFDLIGSVPGFYHDLIQAQNVPYAALINFGGDHIVSLSPELFFQIDNSRKITVRPMKGTAPKTSSKDFLKNDLKNRSENLMIVDLLRNDLGRICEPGSVDTSRLFDVEEYETLWQMTSTIKGQLRPDIQWSDIFRCLFPSGSVTGAPKIRSMELIRELEPAPRNIYTGAIGYIAPTGEAMFNVAIRTILLEKQGPQQYRAEMGIGSGIVHDSDPKNEYEECVLKAKFLFDSLPAFSLIETMLCKDGRIQNLHNHIERLYSSARYFNIPFSSALIKKQLKTYCAKLTGQDRVRMLVDRQGNISIEHVPVTPRPTSEAKIILSKQRTRSDDPFLYHKTTYRKLYNDEFTTYASQGYADVIFLNEKDEVTEGAISNIFLKKNGRYFTPPVSCGLLKGTQRQAAMKKLQAREQVLTVNDLKSADELYITNAVRGMVKVDFK